MWMSTIYCPVIGERVASKQDLERATSRVLCVELDRETGLCRAQSRAHRGGWLSEYLERLDEHAINRHGDRCPMLGAHDVTAARCPKPESPQPLKMAPAVDSSRRALATAR